MSTEMTWQILSTSSEQTEQLAEAIGAKLRGGEVIELVSDLGGGKTTFTRGLARGAKSTEAVASPTFTISREYACPNFTIAHFDFYRLSEAGVMADELSEIIGDKAYVTVVEWGEIVHDVLPKARCTITISQTAEGDRDIVCTYPASHAYMFEDVR